MRWREERGKRRKQHHYISSPSLSHIYRTVNVESDTTAQIVPDMEDKQHRSDIAMAMKTEGLPSSSSHSSGTGTALHLVHSDSHSTHVPSPVHPVAASLAFQGSPIHVATSPVHPGPIPFQGSPVHFTTSPAHAGSISFHSSTLNASSGPQLILNSDLSSAYLLTPLTPSLSPGNSSAFFNAHSPPPSTLLNASPTHSLELSSSPPVHLPTSPSSSLSVPRHRPVGPSQSVDSYFTSSQIPPQASPPTTISSPSSSFHVRPTALVSSAQHSRSILLPSVSESGSGFSTTGNGNGSSAFVVSSPVESIVTMGASSRVVDGDHNGHSFTSVDAVGAVSQAGPWTPTHRRRRNSSGDLNNTRVRRSSQGCHAQSPSASMETTSLASALHHGRVRRRSHDHHMEGRSRTSRSGSREPYTLNPQ